MPFLMIRLRKWASQFKRAIPGLSPAVAKERTVKARNLRQHFCKLGLILVEEEIRDMNQSPSLPLNHLQNRRMTVAKRVDPDSTEEIQVPSALRIPQVHAFPPREEDRLPLISGKQELPFHACHGGETHALNTSVPHSILVK